MKITRRDLIKASAATTALGVPWVRGVSCIQVHRAQNHTLTESSPPLKPPRENRANTARNLLDDRSR